MKRIIRVLLAAALLFSLAFSAYQWDFVGKMTNGFADKEYSLSAEDGTQAKEFLYISEKQAAYRIGSLCQEDMLSSDILASVTAAQFIIESHYGRSELAKQANNCFGMKCDISGNTWEGSTWDGVSKYTKKTKEEDAEGNMIEVEADFRKYSCVEESIADHSAYLLGAMDGDRKRYEGIAGETDYRKAAQIIKDGGYSTNSDYVDWICEIIEEYDLTRFDQTASLSEAAR